MKMKLLGLIACMALLGVSQAGAATFTYTVNSALESGELTGTIQTDCDSCTLFTSDITGYNLNITDAGGQSFTLVSGSSNVFLANNGALTATATGLFFNFSATVSTQFGFQPAVFAEQDSVCFSTNTTDQCVQHLGGVDINGPIPPNELDQFPLTGSQEIASASVSATPLPAALPLFATGLGGLGLFGWRRKRKAAAIAA
jgi:hypothetical protein